MKTKLTILFLLLSMIVVGQNKLDVNTATFPRSIYIQGVDTNVISGDKFIYVGKDTSNSTRFEQDGSIRLLGTATQWNDMMFPFTTGTLGGASYPTFNADSIWYVFTTPDTTGATRCEMYFIIQLPHDYKENTPIYPHVHYKHETIVGTPNFRIKYKWYASASGAALIFWNWYTMGLTTGTTDKTVQMSYGTGGIGGTHGISSILICKLYTYATPSNVIAFQLDFHYEKDAIGSRTETAK